VPVFAGAGGIDVGSCYLKQSWDDETLERLVAANKETLVDPEPSYRILRGSWWLLRRDAGRSTPISELAPDLGDQIERAIDAIRPAIDAHQAALLTATKSPGSPSGTDTSQSAG
jgi:hypothetical protein